MPIITISGTPIAFPDSGESPNWSEAIIAFAEAVEQALSGIVGPYDVPPQVLNIDAYNVVTDQPITALQFPVLLVRAFTVTYAVYREGDSPTTHLSEAGEFTAVYDPDNSSGSKWSVTRMATAPGANIEFSVSDAGAVSFTTTAVGTINHTGTISFSAKAILQQD